MSVEDRLTEGMQPNSPAAKEALKEHELAKRALEAADAKELYALYERMVKQRAALLTTVIVLGEHLGTPGHPRLAGTVAQAEPLPADVASIKEVAMASIALAQSVIAAQHGSDR